MPGTGDDSEPESHDDDADAVFGPPPHPLDRTWLHPSEIPPAPATAFEPSAPRALRRRWRGPALAVAGGAIGALLALGLVAATGAFDDEPPGRDVTVGGGRPGDPAVASLAASVAPSVVRVVAQGPSGRRTFSGVCVRKSGEVLTSHGLLGDAETVSITGRDGGRWDATIVGRDADTDLALLRIDEPLPAARLASGTPIESGAGVVAVGAGPGGDPDPWVSGGIVASTAVTLAAAKGPFLTDAIETDALTGSAAGGALIDVDGAVVGIVLAPIDGSAAGHAVPIDRAAAVAEELRRDGRVAHGYLGLTGEQASDGVAVTALDPGSPAEVAGLRAGDVVVAVDDEPADSVAWLLATVRGHRPSEGLILTVRRGDAVEERSVRLGEQPPEP